MRIAVMLHVACEPAGAYLPALEKHADVDTYLLGRDEVVSLDHYDGIVVMGGPMGVNDSAEFPWLPVEVRLLRQAMAAGSAVWGVCLGAQLLAAAAGARVGPGAEPEVGVGPVFLADGADHDAVFNGLPSEVLTLHWHQDTFELPADAVLLASSPAYPHQAFRLGRSYGLQFHIEAPWILAEEWLTLRPYADSAEQVFGPGAAARLRHDLLETEAAMTATAEMLIGRWLDLLET